MFKQFIAGAALAFTALSFSAVAKSADATLESAIITSFAPFPPPSGEILFEDGSRKTLSDFPGELVLATVWFTTCPNCQREMPQLDKLAATLKEQGVENIRLLPISIDEIVYRETPEDSLTRVRSYYDRKKLTRLPVALDLSGRNAGALFSPDPAGTPTTFFISPTGDIFGVLEGAIIDWNAPESVAYLRSLAGV